MNKCQICNEEFKNTEDYFYHVKKKHSQKAKKKNKLLGFVSDWFNHQRDDAPMTKDEFREFIVTFIEILED